MWEQTLTVFAKEATREATFTDDATRMRFKAVRVPRGQTCSSSWQEPQVHQQWDLYSPENLNQKHIFNILLGFIKQKYEITPKGG